MYLLNNVFTSEHGEAITVLQLLTKFKCVLSEIDTYLNEYGNRLNSIEFKNVTQQQEIDILKSQVQTLQTNISNLQLTVGDYLLRFTDLDMQLTVINGKIDSNTTDITSLNTSISSIQSSITNINNQITTITNQITGINTRIDVALSSISNLNDDVSNINTTLSTHTNTINTLNTNVNELTTLVNNLQNTCTTLTTDLNDLTSRVSYLETNDTWQNGQISSLTTTSQLNTNNISALNTIVGNINGDVSDLENRVEILENQNSIVHELVPHELIPHDNLTGYYTVNANNYLDIFPFPVDVTKYPTDTYLSLLIEGNVSIQRNGTPTLSFMMPDGSLINFILPSSTDNYSFINFKLYFNYYISTPYSNNRLYYWGNLLVNDGSNNFNKNISTAGNQPTGTYSTFPIQNLNFKVKSSSNLYHRGHFLITNFK